jgi:hypothetical protein
VWVRNVPPAGLAPARKVGAGLELAGGPTAPAQIARTAATDAQTAVTGEILQFVQSQNTSLLPLLLPIIPL